MMAPIEVPLLKIYHNPKCGKSRAALALLQEHGLKPRVVEYLQSPPSAAELKAIVAMLGIRPEELVRKGEEIYKARYAGKTLSDEQWIAAMVRDPILIERPIVVVGRRAVIGRPPETVLALLCK
ncbi:MAG TPA: arsenate reductase (glutaredoxin) [Steroidobacteraceae bacterium]|nr:arsenate reductase (glutaredoxin) [Steroidobacteraceae bacterium]